jgi:KUP system potassium uptake protein
MIMTESNTQQKSRLPVLALAALGIVYGDIGTSPLYAMKEVFAGTHPVPITPGNIFGILSLVFWCRSSTWSSSCAPTTAARVASWR